MTKLDFIGDIVSILGTAGGIRYTLSFIGKVKALQALEEGLSDTDSHIAEPIAKSIIKRHKLTPEMLQKGHSVYLRENIFRLFVITMFSLLLVTGHIWDFFVDLFI